MFFGEKSIRAFLPTRHALAMVCIHLATASVSLRCGGGRRVREPL